MYYTSPQSFIITFSYSLTLGTSVKLIVCFIKLSDQTFQPLILRSERVILRYIIGNVHQFIGHCLIPLDPWFMLLCMITIILQLESS